MSNLLNNLPKRRRRGDEPGVGEEDQGGEDQPEPPQDQAKTRSKGHTRVVPCHVLVDFHIPGLGKNCRNLSESVVSQTVNWCLQDPYVIYPSFLCEAKIWLQFSRFCPNHVMS